MATAFSTLYTELASRLNDDAHALWTLVRKKAFVNGALARWNEIGGFVEIADETKTTNGTDVEYTLPAGVPNAASVIEITVEQGSGEPYAKITDLDPRVINSSGGLPTTATAVKLLIKDAFPTAGKKIRVRYKGPHPALVNAADLTEAPAEFLYTYAKYLAHSEALAKPSLADRKFHQGEKDNALRDLVAMGFKRPREEQRENPPSDW